MTSNIHYAGDADLRRSLDALYLAHVRAAGCDDDVPSLIDSRELVRLFIQIRSDDIRHALLGLMRAIAASRG